MDFLSLFNHSNYTLDKVIGQGGMAIVYLGEHKVMKRPVAIKFLLPEFMGHENIRKRFLSEGRNMFSMNHENIVRVIDLIDQPDLVAIVMEYVAGYSLKKMIDDYGALEEEEIREFFPQMLKAVGYVHAQGLIHRDLKPSNFMVSADGKVKLFDFGIAKSLQVEKNIEHTVTGTNQTLGTPLYMSPEQVKETRNVSHLTDIYSMGVVLWQMIKGSKPYGSNTLSLFELQTKIVHEPLEKTGTIWDGVIQKATQKEPGSRYQHCESMLSDFERPSDNQTIIGNIIKKDFEAETLINMPINIDRSEANEEKGNIDNNYASSEQFDLNEEVLENLNKNEQSPVIEKQYMFSKLFSFNGRIRRTEYCLSFIVFQGFNLISYEFLSDESPATLIVLTILSILFIWMILAQGSKRCHDLGKHAAWQIVPFYILWMFFKKGQNGYNMYGRNPKN